MQSELSRTMLFFTYMHFVHGLDSLTRALVSSVRETTKARESDGGLHVALTSDVLFADAHGKYTTSAALPRRFVRFLRVPSHMRRVVFYRFSTTPDVLEVLVGRHIPYPDEVLLPDSIDFEHGWLVQFCVHVKRSPSPALAPASASNASLADDPLSRARVFPVLEHRHRIADAEATLDELLRDRGFHDAAIHICFSTISHMIKLRVPNDRARIASSAKYDMTLVGAMLKRACDEEDVDIWSVPKLAKQNNSYADWHHMLYDAFNTP